MKDSDSIKKEVGQITALGEAHSQVRLITIKRWFATSLLLFFALVAVYWACTGHIPVTSGGKCVILDQGGKTRLLGFFSMFEAESIHAGMEALVDVGGIDSSQFGSLRAHVASVSSYPVNADSPALSLIPSQVLREFLTRGKVPQVLVELEPVSNSEFPSGLEWTSRPGPPHQISSGSVGEVQVILKKVRPISYVIPEA